ncbi:MAG: DUF2075 domain-containing protein [Candidatus Eisenbacteria bacterium]|nr:DUF2075 domain-containing protein [Candidatus Eisenbacteria bacterium]
MTRVFHGTLQEFQYKLRTNALFREMDENYPRVVGHSPGPSERSSWRASLPRLAGALQLAELPDDVHIALEERVPYFGKRMDVCLFGHTEREEPWAVITELKAWGEALATPEGNVCTVIGGGLQAEPHPSEQVHGYHEHIEDFRRAFQGDARLGLASCAYCHNYPGIIPDEGLFHPQFDRIREDSPCFGERDAELLARYLRVRLRGGRGRQVLEAYDERGIGPSKQLIDHAGLMIRQQGVFRLLDEQIPANRKILSAVGSATHSRRKQVILVRGGPGTGKSVIALNALGEILRRELSVNLVTGSAAFTHGMRRILGKRIDALVKFTDYYWDKPLDGLDVLIVDEAHRIRAKSVPRVPTAQRPTISQVEELIRAARVTVFFADENQIISPEEVGEPSVFRETARRLKAHFSEFTLSTQFRCNGSDAYLAWLDDVLELAQDPQGLRLAVPSGFRFRIVDSPDVLVEEVMEHNRARSNSARVLGGWCWEWSDPLPDRLVDDIVIGDFRFPWESKNNRKPPPGIPEAKHWAIDPAGVRQAGCVYSVQGFETGHVGVIVGPDLVRRRGAWLADPKQNYANKLRGQSPAAALPYIKRIYRTLLSRGMESCTVYCVDEETREFLRSRLLPAAT